MQCIKSTSIQAQIRSYIYNCVFESEQAIVLLRFLVLRYLKRLKEYLTTMNMVVRKDKMLVTTSIVSRSWEQLDSLRSLDQSPLSQVVTRSGAQEEAQTVPPG